ncbi:uncharacterized protein LOC108863734 [Galendromus occidentalis]|uniref:Uncharacterized protein LOC108863734 n=1 Tax=Galendromus occidentalis TaxID=34638 RepID=A0AAJ7L4L5_9ACAR|nr:uncharacterized protein LOC108863734 [Galendromus occidentalis]
MMLKSSLEVYRLGKNSLGIQTFLYGNRRGDTLLALARAGILPTKSRGRSIDPQQEDTCLRCGTFEETVNHVIFERNDAYDTDEDFLSRLGLHEEKQGPSIVTKTQRILEKWEKETKDLLLAPDMKG